MGIGNIANTGMQAAMSNMEVISNNIANANTYGFKKSYVNFADLYPAGNASSGVQSGLGVQVTNILQDFTTSGTETTGIGTDLSIKNQGMFIIKDSVSGQVSYSRYGRFVLDKDGYLVNRLGASDRLQGYPATNNTILPGTTPVDLQVDINPLPASATTTVNQTVNLDSNSVVPTGTFSASDPTTFNFTSEAAVYDSLGNQNDLRLYYIKTSSNNWTVNAEINGVAVGSGTVTFNSNGSLNTTTGLSAMSFNPSGGAQSPQTFAINLTGSTQFASANTANAAEQDGFAAATWSSVSIDSSGKIFNVYSNGKQTLSGQIALAEFQSPQGLQNIGNQSWIATSESGTPTVNQDTSNGNFGVGFVELSNVDLTEEMVALIGAQHNFQANAQVEQTFNEVMQTIIQL